MPNYSQGKIYKIVNSVNNFVYVGSTTQTLSSRMSGHRASAKRRESGGMYPAMNELGSDKFQIILIEEFSCLNKMQLEAREYKVMVDMKFANIPLYNLVVDGKMADSTREKMRVIHTGKVVSKETREKLSAVHIGKTHSTESKEKMRVAKQKRGCIRFDRENRIWVFRWQEGFKRCKSFSVNRYGAHAARGLALFWQDEVYPVEREDDSEFLQELKKRLQN